VRATKLSLMNCGKLSPMITPTVAEAVAKCVIFGALPAYGFYLLYLSVDQSLRSGKVGWFTAGAL
jgi:hypothetical protein